MFLVGAPCSVESGRVLGTVFLQHLTPTLSFVSICQVKEDYKEYFSQRNSKGKRKEEKGTRHASGTASRSGRGWKVKGENTYACV